MKKFAMLLFTLIIFFITGFVYINQNTNLPEINYKYPQINFTSKKFGEIRNIIFEENQANHIFILAGPKKNSYGVDISSVYDMDIDTGKVESKFDFETNESLKDYMFYDQMRGRLLTASPQGINAININYDEKGQEIFSGSDFYPIEDFNNISSLFIGSRVYYTKTSSKLLYIKDIQLSGMDFFSQPSQENLGQNLYLPVNSVVFSLMSDQGLYYTRLEKNGLNLYKLSFSGNMPSVKKELVQKNVIYAGDDLFLWDGYTALINLENKYGIFSGSRSGGKILTEIPKGIDMLGEVPSVTSRRYSSISEIAYTQFDGKHMGSIYFMQSPGSPLEVVKDMPIVGPIRISMPVGSRILFFTKDRKGTHLYVVGTDGKGLKDITGFIE